MGMNAASPPSGFESYFEWTAGGMIDPDPAPAGQWAAIAALSDLQLLDRIIEGERNLERRNRMVKARMHFSRSLYDAFASNRVAGVFPAMFTTEPGRLRDLIHKKLPEAMCLGMLIAAEMDSPFSPFVIRLSEVQFKAAQAQFARDLGVPARWAEQAKASVAAVSSKRGLGNWKTWPVVIGDELGAVASVPLAFVFASAGLGGRAVFLSGLAAMGGPAAMTAQLSVVAGLAAVGGTSRVAEVLLTGPEAQVEARVRILHANAHAKQVLRPATPVPETPLLEAMLIELNNDLARHQDIDEGLASTPVKQIKTKMKAVTEALTALSKLMRQKGRQSR